MVTSFSYKGNFIENVLLLLKCVLFLVYSKVATLSNNSTVEFIKVYSSSSVRLDRKVFVKTINFSQRVHSLHLLQLQLQLNVFFCPKNVCLRLCVEKTCICDFSLRPRLIWTPR